jgi:hypothetical protein
MSHDTATSSVHLRVRTVVDAEKKVCSPSVFFLEGATDMRNETEPTEASRQYAAAYVAHYTGRDLPLALQLYKKLMASHPSAKEADYSRMQVQNIVNAVVPKQDLLDAQMELVRVHFEREGLLGERADIGDM